MTATFISIDWGGTHLKGICIQGSETSETFELPSSNLRTVSPKELIEICHNLYNLVKKICQPPYIWLIGAAGAGNESVVKMLKSSINTAAGSTQQIEVYPDFLCNHAASLCGEDGILSVNGTGSILFGTHKNKVIRIGGWGYLFDTTPSGGYFGKKYLEAVLMGTDNHPDFEYYTKNYSDIEKKTPNSQEILNQIYTIPSIQNFFGQYSRRLTEAYDQNEPYAVETIDNSIENLSQSIAHLLSQLSLEETKITGSGGLWDNWPRFKDLVLSSFIKKGLQLQWYDNKKPLVYGPMYYYARSK